MSQHLAQFGLVNGGVIRCDQGGELARSKAFVATMLNVHNYVVEPTGADSPSQNGGIERWNDFFPVTVRARLLCGHRLSTPIRRVTTSKILVSGTDSCRIFT